MLKMILAVLMVAGLVSCTDKSPACAVAKTISAHVASEIKTQLACSNESAILADIELQVAKLRVCEVKAESIIGDVVCGPLIDGLLSGALTKVPAAWGCAGGPLKDGLKEQLLNACKKSI